MNGSRLKLARQSRGVSEEQFASDVKLTVDALRRIERKKLDAPDRLIQLAVTLLDYPESFFLQGDPPRWQLGSLLWHNPEWACTCGNQYEFADYLCDWPMGKGTTCDMSLCKTCAREIGDDLHVCKIHHAVWQTQVGGRVNSWPPPSYNRE